jgi:transposase InsO family protein
VKRNFTSTAPNRLWLTDITEHRTDEGKPYLCAIKDVYSNRIVGHRAQVQGRHPGAFGPRLAAPLQSLRTGPE